RERQRRLGYEVNYSHGAVRPLGPGRRHEWGGVTSKERFAEPERLGDETAERRDRLLDRRTGLHRFGCSRIQAPPQLIPEPIIAPALDLLVRRHLHIVAAARRGALRAQGEAALVVSIDEFFGHRRLVDQHAEPTKRVDPLECRERFGGYAGAADAVVAIAAGDVVAVEAVGDAVLLPRYPGLAVEI